MKSITPRLSRNRLEELFPAWVRWTFETGSLVKTTVARAVNTNYLLSNYVLDQHGSNAVFLVLEINLEEKYLRSRDIRVVLNTDKGVLSVNFDLRKLVLRID